MNVNPSLASRRFLMCQAILFLAFVTGVLGCGGPELATVSGTVTFKGDKVKGGMLIFSPMKDGSNRPGEPAAATIQEDGSFTLKTGEAEGAIIGKSTVTFSPPGGEAAVDYKKEGKPSPYVGLAPKDPTIEVKSGKNTFNIELVKGK